MFNGPRSDQFSQNASNDFHRIFTPMGGDEPSDLFPVAQRNLSRQPIFGPNRRIWPTTPFVALAF